MRKAIESGALARRAEARKRGKANAIRPDSPEWWKGELFMARKRNMGCVLGTSAVRQICGELERAGVVLEPIEEPTRGVSLNDCGRDMDLFVSNSEEKQAEEILQRYGLSGREKIIGINPGAKYGTAKRWFPDRYAELCNRLLEMDETAILIFGGPGEESLGEYIQNRTGNQCIDLSGKTGLRAAIALIKRCRLFITNDSGLMHAAAALDIPQIAVIGSTDPVATGPSNPRSRIVQVPTSCSPCLKPECPIDHRCMTRITVYRVPFFT